MVSFKEIYHFSAFQRGSNIFKGGGGGEGGPTFSRGVQHFQGGSWVQHFQGGGPTFSGGGGGGRGSNCLFPIETHITCDFPGGYGPPVPPSGSALEIHIQIYKLQNVKGLERKLECLYYSSLS